MENHHSSSYDSHFSFSFFTGNIAKKTYGHDLATQIVRSSADCISHSFTTATSNSFWNVDGHMNNWLPQGRMPLPIDIRTDTGKDLYIIHRTKYIVLDNFYYKFPTLTHSTAFSVLVLQRKLDYRSLLPILHSLSV